VKLNSPLRLGTPEDGNLAARSGLEEEYEIPLHAFCCIQGEGAPTAV
jgi:hypothetical protein